MKDTAWWNDETLARLRREMRKALDAWDEVRPDPSTLVERMSDEQRNAMATARAAEMAYDARRRELDLI